MSTHSRTRRRTVTEDSMKQHATPNSSSNNVQTIQVVAPCDMEEGYTFMAEVTTSVIWPGAVENDTVTSIQPVQVIVPKGGVKKGQIFWAFPEVNENSPFCLNNISYNNQQDLFLDDDLNRSNDEMGEVDEEEHLAFWKDGLFDCFRFGFFHPTVWNALCCPQLLIGQILTRLNLNWLAEDRTPLTNPYYDNPYLVAAGSSINASIRKPTVKKPNCWRRQTAFTQILIIVCIYWIVTTVLCPPKIIDDNKYTTILVPSLITSPTNVGNNPANPLQQPIGARPIIVPEPKNHNDDDDKKDNKHWKYWKKYEHLRKYLYHTCSWVFGCYTLIVLTHLRRAIRGRYSIPSQAAFDGYIEDICMSFWCGCCSVAQMARQTCHYEEDDIAACCTSTGLALQKQNSQYTTGSTDPNRPDSTTDTDVLSSIENQQIIQQKLDFDKPPTPSNGQSLAKPPLAVRSTTC